MSFQDLGIPVSSSTVTVKAFNVVEGTVAVPASMFLTPVLPGHEDLLTPIFAFLIENIATKQRVMFDLGPRKDLENAAPAIVHAFKSLGLSMPVERDIVEQLVDTGVTLKSISAVIWSHSHFDHTGDMLKFPSSTDLVFGQDMARATCATDPTSTLLETDLADRKLVPVNFANSPLEFGGLKAHDFFGDGSLYLLDVPGHALGHICALARVTPSSFLFLGGDACHHPGQFRPTDKLHKHFPCPGELLAATRRSVSATHFGPSNSAGEFDLAARTTPLLDVAENAYYADPPTARASIEKMGSFDANADVFVVLAHDSSLLSVVEPFPALMDDWKAKGWKNLVTWAFLDEKNPAFTFNAKAAA
ncbi:beta-lactamase-like protein [Mycena rosella]|uniref:Beta-lactamase-like protein n=1 Tax=Mycena rosella TaxID=1033263 RepID=A0AAD7DQ28_MYCRO|nr:beta-lactamase-like protein [Mycena rosella]